MLIFHASFFRPNFPFFSLLYWYFLMNLNLPSSSKEYSLLFFFDRWVLLISGFGMGFFSARTIFYFKFLWTFGIGRRGKTDGSPGLDYKTRATYLRMSSYRLCSSGVTPFFSTFADFNYRNASPFINYNTPIIMMKLRIK